jgi:hypothetical protein
LLRGLKLLPCLGQLLVDLAELLPGGAELLLGRDRLGLRAIGQLGGLGL